ncbi:MAG: YafY family transcriptional regulator [Anaerolineae bacterium]|nr:YafY family transcriptional regulator [Anaerolineae bacterium]
MRADRLVSMVLLLQTRGRMTAEALAAELGVSRRTILRDLDALSTSGIPIYAEGGHGGGISLDEGYRTSLTGLNEQEARALFLGGNKRLLEDIGLGGAAESTHLKLTAALPDRHHAAVSFMQQRIYIDPLWWWHEGEPQSFWAELQQAVYADQCIQAVYENYNGEIAERVLEPYSLVCKSSYWYLVARRDDQMRTYRVSRFRQIVRLDQHFARDPAFDLQTYWHAHLDSFIHAFSEYEFTLCVHPDKLNFVRWLLPGRTTVINTREDAWVTLRCQIESMVMATMMVIGLGDQGEIMSPPELRDTVLQTCQTTIDHISASVGSG